MSYISFLPGYLQEVKEFAAIGAAVDEQTALMIFRRSELLADRLISTASAGKIKRWETVLGLPLNPALSLDERRYAVLAKLRMRALITLKKLAEQLNQITDEGATVDVDYGLRTIKVQLALHSKNNHATVLALLREMIPANMIISLNQLYNRWSDYHSITWAGLSAKTWRQMREEII